MGERCISGRSRIFGGSIDGAAGKYCMQHFTIFLTSSGSIRKLSSVQRTVKENGNKLYVNTR